MYLGRLRVGWLPPSEGLDKNSRQWGIFVQGWVKNDDIFSKKMVSRCQCDTRCVVWMCQYNEFSASSPHGWCHQTIYCQLGGSSSSPVFPTINSLGVKVFFSVGTRITIVAIGTVTLNAQIVTNYSCTLCTFQNESQGCGLHVTLWNSNPYWVVCWDICQRRWVFHVCGFKGQLGSQVVVGKFYCLGKHARNSYQKVVKQFWAKPARALTLQSLQFLP